MSHNPEPLSPLVPYKGYGGMHLGDQSLQHLLPVRDGVDTTLTVTVAVGDSLGVSPGGCLL
jgi:hypothetical protein